MYKDIKAFEKAKQENPALNIFDWIDGKMFYQGKLVDVATEDEEKEDLTDEEIEDGDDFVDDGEWRDYEPGFDRVEY